ncbi:MAG: ankyrin repeat domain-containing protein [Candidatus Eisenbacteria bacterium]|uniref:Ankyrin repeat domain-containing protein n=1 Tax=Eiseniibacteriota bacterium TaxID=2212470 RepID=A0A933W2P2_UNCEI|nr:ankyrin repeat domain-containing protein [Candidatus Eisenbacteria bacterium]
MTPNDTELITLLKAGDTAGALALLAARPLAARERDASGVSPLMWSLYLRQGEVSEALRAALPELDVFEAVSTGDAARVATLLSADRSLARARSGDGFTALHFAAFFSRPELAASLLAAGADPAAVADNPMRVQPLHSAAAARSLETCRVLLESGAPPDAAQHQGWTALMSAAQHGLEPLVDLLLAHGARLDVRAGDGRTAAELATAAGHHELAARLTPPSVA